MSRWEGVAFVDPAEQTLEERTRAAIVRLAFDDADKGNYALGILIGIFPPGAGDDGASQT